VSFTLRSTNNQPINIDRLTYQASSWDIPPEQSEIFIAGPRGLFIVSDIDETLKPLGWTPDTAAYNLFFTPYTVFEGIAETLNGWMDQERSISTQLNAPIMFYQSLCAWQILPALLALIKRHNLPAGPVAVRRFRMDRFVFSTDIISEALRYAHVPKFKEEKISTIIEALPNRTFVLLGDSAMQDPAAYGDLMRRYASIKLTGIRKMPGLWRRFNKDARFEKDFKGVGHERWRVYDDLRSLKYLNVSSNSN
jgi:phosphatidate phosphatase APP1